MFCIIIKLFNLNLYIIVHDFKDHDILRAKLFFILCWGNKKYEIHFQQYTVSKHPVATHTAENFNFFYKPVHLCFYSRSPDLEGLNRRNETQKISMSKQVEPQSTPIIYAVHYSPQTKGSLRCLPVGLFWKVHFWPDFVWNYVTPVHCSIWSTLVNIWSWSKPFIKVVLKVKTKIRSCLIHFKCWLM